MAVACMMFIKELRRKSGETADFFLPFLVELDIFESFEAILFFVSDTLLMFCANVRVIFF